MVCGTTGAADSKISNQPLTVESNKIGIVRFEFESNLEASQVPSTELHYAIHHVALPLSPASRALYITVDRTLGSVDFAEVQKRAS